MINKYLQPRKYLQLSKRVIADVLRHTPIIRKNHRLRSRIDCITEACNLIEGNYGGGGSNAINKSILRRLSRLGINFSQFPANHKGDLYALLADQPLQAGRYDELKNNLTKAPAELLPCRQWLNLHEMCCFRGRYTLGQIFREKARHLAIKPLDGKEFEPPISWENTIGAAIEGGECHRSEYLAQLLQRAGITGDAASKWQLYLAVLNGLDISCEWVKLFDDSGFVDYLAGKKVAIVGPVPTEALDAEEIDNYDLVVRLNHSYEGKGAEPEYKGLRTDVTCFNGEQSESFMNQNKGKIPKEVTWVCFKSPRLVDSVRVKNIGKFVRAHIAFNQSKFHGTFNMMPLVALDLSLFSNAPLKIFHTDLMLTTARQKGYYPKSFSRSIDTISMKKIIRRSSVAHDPIQQYRTLHALWLNKRITGDTRFTEVMEMGLENYLHELEMVYANHYTHGRSTVPK